jgi:regulator of chromosome condensation
MATVNPLPTAPVHERPPLLLFGWGANDFGQLCMGTEANKPKRNTWVEQKIDEDAFGEDGAGLESIAAGGMHTLFIDERGTVSNLCTHSFVSPGLIFGHRFGRVA